MTEFRCPVVRVGPVEPHQNADALEIVKVWGYPVVIRKGQFKPGDLAVYIPVDAIVPDLPEWGFLNGSRRVKAKKLRGVFSMGLLTEASSLLSEGDDATAFLGIEKYEPPVHSSTGGENEHCPHFFPTYTDIEGLRRWGALLVDGEPVVVTEKLHGANGRWMWKGGRLWVGSRTCVKKDGDTIWWQVARRYDLPKRIEGRDVVLFGEVFGQVQDLKYGHDRGAPCSMRVFDVFDLQRGAYMDWQDVVAFCSQVGLDHVPVLHEGPWSPTLMGLAEGESTLATHVREGFVVKPARERQALFSNVDPEGKERGSFQRVILKMVGQGYHLRKE